MNTQDIQNFMYPCIDCAEKEIERLDGVLLQEGYIILDGKEYHLTRKSTTEYYRGGVSTRSPQCSWVRYHWYIRPTTYKQDGWRAAGYR